MTKLVKNRPFWTILGQIRDFGGSGSRILAILAEIWSRIALPAGLRGPLKGPPTGPEGPGSANALYYGAFTPYYALQNAP